MDTLDAVAIVGLGYVGLPLAVAFGRLIMELLERLLVPSPAPVVD